MSEGSCRVCTRCEEPIAVKRLQIIPWPAHCVRCHELLSCPFAASRTTPTWTRVGEAIGGIEMTETYDRTFLHRRSLASPYVELRRVAASRVADISPFVDQLMRFMRLLFDKFRDADGSEAVEIALTEALANAVIHGNRENPNKTVVVICRCAMDGEVSITVRDEGAGFNSRSLP